MQASLRSLLQKKPIDRIAVREIVADCGLTRNTFYYYYADIYDLLDEYLNAQMRLAWQSLPEGSPWEAVLVRLLDSLCDTPQTGRHIFFSRKRAVMLQYLHKAVRAIAERYLAQEQPEAAPSEADRELICAACSYALYGMIETWLNRPDADALQTGLTRLTGCFSGTIREALRYCAANPAGGD